MGAPGWPRPEGPTGGNTVLRKPELLLVWQQAERITSSITLQIWMDMLERWMYEEGWRGRSMDLLKRSPPRRNRENERIRRLTIWCYSHLTDNSGLLNVTTIKCLPPLLNICMLKSKEICLRLRGQVDVYVGFNGHLNRLQITCFLLLK